MKNNLIIEDWGRIGFEEAWKLQTRHQQALIERKRNAQSQNIKREAGNHFLIFCEHPHVYTIGKTGSGDHLLVGDDYLRKHNIAYHHINRGGDITYHGPGQLVIYPILDLEFFFRDLHRYIRLLEEMIIRTMADLGLEGYRRSGFTGVWTGPSANRKICAIGVHMSRWVSMHGLAFNVKPDLIHFDHIIPCGIKDKEKSVTSIAAESGKEPDMASVKSLVRNHFVDLFEIDNYETKQNLRRIDDSDDAIDLAQ